MSASPVQAAKSADRCARNIGLSTTLLLAISAGAWFADNGWRQGLGLAILRAAEPQAADEPAATSKIEAPSVDYFPRPSKYEVKIFEALDKPTRVDFAGVPFEKCIADLHDFHKIIIVLDKSKITEKGIAFDQPITLRLAGVSLRSILKLLLEPVQLTYLIENDVMKITTSEACSERLLIRVYPVRDLYHGRSRVEHPASGESATPRAAADRPGDLETAISRSIEPDSWDEKNGPGTMTYVQASGSLVIRQTAAVHDQILQLLRDLREAKRVGDGNVAPVKPGSPKIGWQLRGPQRDESYSLVGIIDFDGDEKSDRLRLHKMIKAVGSRIDNEVDEKGALYVDGRIEDKPILAETTKFVVVGTIPQPADLADPDEIYASLKIAGFYADLEDQARARGVRIIRLTDFLRYLGYEPSNDATSPR